LKTTSESVAIQRASILREELDNYWNNIVKNICHSINRFSCCHYSSPVCLYSPFVDTFYRTVIWHQSEGFGG